MIEPPVNLTEVLTHNRLGLIRDRFHRHYPRCTCGVLWREDPGPVLHDHLWARIARISREMLCDRCTRRRLGRPYTIRDLKPVPFNYSGSFWRWWRGRYARGWGNRQHFEIRNLLSLWERLLQHGIVP